MSVITNISMDHMEFLGDTLSSIAREKGGIIKHGIPLVIGRAGEVTEKILLEMADEKEAPALLAYRAYEPLFQTFNQEMNSLFRIRDHVTDEIMTITSDLNGAYQMENLITAISTLTLMQEKGWFIPEQAFTKGFLNVVENTGLMGRWQTIGYNPRSICDTAHNAAGIARVVKQLSQIPCKTLHMVWGMVEGKQTEQILPLLPATARYYFTPSSVPRSMDAGELNRQASSFGLKGKAHHSVEEAYGAALKVADPDDLIFTGGSTFVVADLLQSTRF
jgi:dihydrofolate synthase/folylpolyglutamate synthase